MHPQTISGNATEYFANDKEYWLWDEQTLTVYP